MKNWNDIRDEISRQETPLSKGAWAKMEKALAAGEKRGGAWWRAALVLMILAGMAAVVWWWPVSGSYYRPRGEEVSFENEYPESGFYKVSTRDTVARQRGQRGKSTLSGSPLNPTKGDLLDVSGARDMANDNHGRVTQPPARAGQGGLDSQRVTSSQSALNSESPLNPPPCAVSATMHGKGDLRSASNGRGKTLANRERVAEPPTRAGLGGQDPTNPNKSKKEIVSENRDAFFILKKSQIAKKDFDFQTEMDAPLLAAPFFFEKEKQGDKTTTFRDRWELRLTAAATYNWANITYENEAVKEHRQFEAAIQNAVQPGWGADFGAELRYRLFGNFYVSSGLGFRQITTQNNYDFVVDQIPVIDSASGNIIAYIPLAEPRRTQSQSRNTYAFLTIPLSLFFEKPLNEKWSLTAEGIHHTSFLLNQNSQRLDATSLELQNPDNDIFNKTVNAWQVRLGLRYQVSEKFQLALEPAYRSYYQDFLTTDEASWKPKDFSLGLTGILKF